MGYEAAGKKIDKLLEQLETEKDTLSDEIKKRKKKVDDALA